jgi:hypothetical protein
LQALLENGLQMVSPDTADVSQWRSIVNDSNRELAADGAFDPALLDRMQMLIRDYRAKTP